MVDLATSGSSNIDDPVDATIEQCLNPEAPGSFFLYAGAGSGKTYSLVEGLNKFKSSNGKKYRKSGRKIAVITYTNAACDEIKDRVDSDPLFHISTIHSFCWLLIKNFHSDIRYWILSSIPGEIAELEEKEAKGRAGTLASITRQRSLSNKRELLAWLSRPRQFTYNPNGENIGKASLSHSQVLNICADFLTTKASFRQIIINQYPFVLIDESQDTNKQLIEALFVVEEQHHSIFGLGLIGDMMQRIYGDGKADLGTVLPPRWARPVKQLNRRSPNRIVSLANDIRSELDSHKQKVLEGKPEGVVRLFIQNADAGGKAAFENEVRAQMADITSDAQWNDAEEVKHLMLEHKMAAVRLGFSDMYEALAASKRLQTGLRSGDLPSVRLFSERILPLYQLQTQGKSHAVMTLLRSSNCPLLDPQFLIAAKDQNNPLNLVRIAVRSIVELIEQEPHVSFYDVLQCIAEKQLFHIPKGLLPFAPKVEGGIEDEIGDVVTEEGEKVSSLEATQLFLATPFKQIEAYKLYVSGEGSFDTHQGVKGREFDRVMVVMDDEAAGGFLFSYEKMFEVKPPTKSDLTRLSKGEETGIERTKRLFYVTCTRAEKSLALVSYTNDPELLKDQVLNKGWFNEDEIFIS